MTPHDYCRQKAAALGSSLYYSTLFLEPPRQQALIAINAFRHEIGAIVRDIQDTEPARAKLAWWRMEICSLYEQRPDHPVTQALAEALQHFPIPQEQLLEVIDGYEMDIDQGRYGDFKTLQLYCYRVSSTISVITAEILGCQNRQTLKFAHELGLALQLADIVRHVGLDARHGRIYLPLDELQQFGVTEDDILGARQGAEVSANLKSLLAFQVQRIKTLHEKAMSLLSTEDRHSQRTLLVLARLQRAVLDEIERDGYQVLDRNLSLTPLRMLWLATLTWLRR